MAQTVCVIVTPSDRTRLKAIAADRNRPQKHAKRASIILASAAGDPVQRVAAQLGVSRPMIWRWQQRLPKQASGLLRDKMRKPGKPPIAAETVARVVALTCADPPHQATHWTGRAMAEAGGISLTSVQRIWAAHRLQPHRVRSFKRSRDPAFSAKLTDIVGRGLWPSPAFSLGRFDHGRLRWLGIVGQIRVLDGDILNLSSMLRILREVKPDEVYRLVKTGVVADVPDPDALAGE